MELSGTAEAPARGCVTRATDGARTGAWFPAVFGVFVSPSRPLTDGPCFLFLSHCCDDVPTSAHVSPLLFHAPT